MSFPLDAQPRVAEVLRIIRTAKNNVASLFTLRMRFNVLRQRLQACHVVDRQVSNASLKKQKTQTFRAATVKPTLLLCYRY